MVPDRADDASRSKQPDRSNRARVRLIAPLAVVILAVAGAAAAWLLGADATQPPAAATPPPSGVASGPLVSLPGPTSTAVRPSPDGTPGVGNIELPGSPELVLFQRQGDDLDLLGWRAGERELGAAQVIHGALRGVTEQQDYLAQLSPDGLVLLMHAHPATSGGPDVFRAFRLDGSGARPIWDSTALGSDVAATFIGPEQLAITAASVLPTGRGWTIADLSGNDAIIHSLDVPPIPRPAPGTSVDYSTQVFNYVPLAMSADGVWLYALSAHASEPLYRPAYRIAIASGEAQSITAFPTTGPSRIGSPLVDPISGRLLLAGPRLTSGPGLVEAWVAGATTPDFRAAFDNVFGAVWLDDGGVITADYDRLPGPFSFRIIRLSATGTPTEPLFTAEGRNAALVGVQPGFVGAYVVSTDSSTRTLVVIRPTDGQVSALQVPEPLGLNGNVGFRP